jgi:hypothetical protein
VAGQVLGQEPACLVALVGSLPHAEKACGLAFIIKRSQVQEKGPRYLEVQSRWRASVNLPFVSRNYVVKIFLQLIKCTLEIFKIRLDYKIVLSARLDANADWLIRLPRHVYVTRGLR